MKADIKSVALELGLEAEFQQENEGKAFQENGTASAKVRHHEGQYCRVLSLEQEGTWRSGAF